MRRVDRIDSPDVVAMETSTARRPAVAAEKESATAVGGGGEHVRTVATGKEEESATKAACGGRGGGECSGGDGERRSRVDAGTGNNARCPEVGLISTWKTGSIGLEILVRQVCQYHPN